MAPEQLTERLRVRPPQSGDGLGYRAIFLDPPVGEWLRPAPLRPFADADILAMLNDDEEHWAVHGFGPWAVLEREAGDLIGRGGLRWTDVDGRLAVELPWAIRSDHWGRGLATEAALAAVSWARSLGLETVVALIRPDNSASRRVAEKAGLRPAGETQHAGLTHVLYSAEL